MLRMLHAWFRNHPKYSFIILFVLNVIWKRKIKMISTNKDKNDCKVSVAECWISTRAGGGTGTFFSTHGNHLPWLSGVHGLKDFLWSAHLHESFAGRIYTYWSVLKSKFVHQRTQEDEHYRENPSNHELLTVRGGDCRASKKMFRGLLPPYYVV